MYYSVGAAYLFLNILACCCWPAMLPVSAVGWMFGWCAPVLGIILIQAIRIKWLGSFYTKKVMMGVDDILQITLPEFLYDNVVLTIKNYLCNLAGVKESFQ